MSHRVCWLLVVFSLCVAGTGIAGGTVGEPVNQTGQSFAAGATETGDDPPKIEVWIDTDRIIHGEWLLVATDPTLDVTVSARSNATNDTELETVIVRRDGRTERSFTPDSDSFSTMIDTSLDHGNNTITIIAEDSTGAVTSQTFTLGKDRLAPRFGLTDPFSSDLSGTIPDGTVNDSVVPVGFRIRDFTNVDGTVSATYKQTSRSVAVPGNGTTRNLLLGPGRNEIRAVFSDELGNARVKEFTLTLSDTSPPIADLRLDGNETTRPAEPVPITRSTTASDITLSGTITDNVWIRNASIRVEHRNANDKHGQLSYTRQIRDPTPYTYEAGGRSVNFSEDLPLRLADRHSRNRTGINYIHLRATDHAGQTTTRTIRINRLPDPNQTDQTGPRRNVPPHVRIDRDRTQIRPDGRVQVFTTVTDKDRNIDSIEITAENASSGNVSDFDRFEDLTGLRSISFNTTLRATERPITVSVRARDEADKREIDRFRLNTTTAETDDSGDGNTPSTPAEPTPSPTPTESTAPTQTRSPSPPNEPTASPTERGSTSSPTTAESTTETTESSGSTPTFTNIPTRTPATETAAESDDSGGILDTVLGLLGTIAPFALAAVVVGGLGYFLFQRIRGDESAS